MFSCSFAVLCDSIVDNRSEVVHTSDELLDIDRTLDLRLTDRDRTGLVGPSKVRDGPQSGKFSKCSYRGDVIALWRRRVVDHTLFNWDQVRPVGNAELKSG